jgi:hypothetical protein
MPLPVSGAISFNAINVELGVAGTTQASLGQASYRTLAGVPSGAISMSNFYGKANQFAFTISSNQTNANLRTLALNAGWNGTSKVVATINSGVYCSANGTGTPALTVNGSFPGGVELINNGFIVGMGGAGGAGGNVLNGIPVNGSVGNSGGLALSVSSAVSITNNSTIAGGGGGGGGGGAAFDASFLQRNSSGGGGGGGRSSQSNSSGGAAGSANGSNIRLGTAGSPGTVSAAGGGGAGGSQSSCVAGGGGSGGGWGSSGSNGSNASEGETRRNGGSGGSAGGAVTGNSNITWIATGTRLGAIS